MVDMAVAWKILFEWLALWAAIACTRPSFGFMRAHSVGVVNRLWSHQVPMAADIGIGFFCRND